MLTEGIFLCFFTLSSRIKKLLYVVNCKMSAPIVHRAFSNAIRQIGRSRPKYPLVAKRAASTKHPKGFVAPSSEDLLELRERVQEFTSR